MDNKKPVDGEETETIKLDHEPFWKRHPDFPLWFSLFVLIVSLLKPIALLFQYLSRG